jgi:hypothetical protein
MGKVAPIQNNFNKGELSPLMYGRVDFEGYKGGLKTCINHIPLVQGGITRRPGTVFVAEVKDSSKATRLVRFEFSTTQAYILEFGNLYMRVYANHGQVQSGGSPVEIVTPYTEAELSELSFVQSVDTLFVAHKNHAPRSITRTSSTSWSIGTLTFLDGPYLPVNGTATTLTLGAATGTGVTCTASANLFASTDVGRHIRAKTTGGVWGWAKITAFTSATSVTVDIQQAMGATTATANWRLGVWSDTTSYPAVVTFYQDRLGWAGSDNRPQSVYFSSTGDYYNHQPTAYDTSGTVSDSNALSFTLNSSDVQVIRWMVGDAKGLLIGTAAAEWLVTPSTLNQALTPTNINAVEMTRCGSATVSAIRAGATSLFIQRSGRKMRELVFVYTEDRYQVPDLTVLSEHITTGGLIDMAYQQEPQTIVWCVRADGTLIGFTYQRDQKVIGWHRHVLGGVSDASGTQAKVESVACIPEPNGAYDELWMVVQRYVNGAVVRHIEYMAKIWEHGDAQDTAVYVDASLTYSGSAATTISGLDHLEGETVTILANGATHPTKVVSSGAVTLDRSTTVAVIGYGYNSDGQTLRNDAGAADGTAQGKTQRKHRVAFRLLDALGIKVGPDFSHLTRRVSRTTADSAGAAVPLFSGDDTDTWEGDYSTEDLIAWRFDQPLPGTLLAILPQQATIDR